MNENYKELLEDYIERKPPVVRAVQFRESNFLSFEPAIHRSTVGPEPGFVHTGTGGVVYPVNDSDWLCFVQDPLFPFGQDTRDFSGGMTFIMSDKNFNKSFMLLNSTLPGQPPVEEVEAEEVAEEEGGEKKKG